MIVVYPPGINPYLHNMKYYSHSENKDLKYKDLQVGDQVGGLIVRELKTSEAGRITITWNKFNGNPFPKDTLDVDPDTLVFKD